MGEIVKLHQPCPHCGSSDALSVYADGGAKCFSCGKSWKHFDKDVKGDSKRNMVTEIKEDAGRFPVNGIPDRCLTADTCKKFGVKVVIKAGGIAQHIYPYYNKAGEMVAQKVRTVEGKQFHCLGQMRQAMLFGQQLFPAKGKYITVTEGEIDAMSVWQMQGGRSPVISIKDGCNGVRDIKENYEYLDSFENIVLCFDGDEAGRKAVVKIAELLPPKKVKIVKLPKDMKDPNEFLKAGKAAEFINSYWWKAEEYRPDDIVNYSDLWQRIEEFNRTKSYLPTPWTGLNEKICGFRPSQLIVFAPPWHQGHRGRYLAG